MIKIIAKKKANSVWDMGSYKTPDNHLVSIINFNLITVLFQLDHFVISN